MTNAEKFLEVFGFDLPIKHFCTCWNDENDKIKQYCDNECTDKPSCFGWAIAEYKENKNENDD